MRDSETILASILVMSTLAATSFFGIRQCRLLLSKSNSDEYRMLRRSALRRLCVSVLLAGCAILIALPYLTGLADEVAQIGHDRIQDAPVRPMTELELHAARSYGLLWLGVAFLLMTAIIVIAVDMVVVRRYWHASYQRLKDDRSAMLSRQLDRLRSERGYFDNSN